jgi:hypothetical protein
MSLTTLPIEHEYQPGDAQAAEGIPFQFLTGADIDVVHIDAATGAVSALLPDDDYVIAGDGPAGTATITATADWPLADSFLVRRRTPIKQDAAINAHQALPSRDVARQLDRVAMVVQEDRADLADARNRSWLVPRGETGGVLPSVADRAGKFRAWDVEGNEYASNGGGADDALREDLAETGDALNAYQPGGAGAVQTSLRARLQRDVWVEDYFAGLSPGDDYQPAFDRAMDVARARGRSKVRMETMIDTASTIALRSGMSIEGDGTHYRWDNDLEANVYEGAWIRNDNAAGGPVLRYGSMQDSRLRDVGIFCGEEANTVAISIGSDNSPSTQSLYFEKFIVVGAALAVRWGDQNAATPLEQCDAITFRDFSFHSCVDGFRLDANNVADTSLIERGRLYQMQGLGFDLRNCGILRISECQAGLLYAESRMFKIGGLAPDQLIIQLCQSEGLGGKMFEINGNNDQGATHLIGCVINQPVECNGIVRVTSTGCYINTTIDLDGYGRWSSTNDVWDGPLGQPQVTVANGAQFDAVTQRDANGQNGVWLPRGMKVKQANLTAGGYEYLGAMRAGIYGETFSVGAGYYYPGFRVLPTVDNGFAYNVTVAAGVTGAEPAWPTGIGDTVVSGGVAFQCIGASAIVKGVGGIQA